MNTSTLFHSNFAETKKDVLKSLDRTVESMEEDVNVIREWLKTQSHLPEVTSNAIIERFLLANKGSIELTKEKLDNYYTFRTLVPEFFRNKNPSLPHMRQMADVVFYAQLPKLNRDLCRVSIIKLNDPDAEKYDIYNYFAHILNITEIKIAEEYNASDIYIYDLDKYTAAHLIKVTPVFLKKMSVVLEKVYSNRVRQIHLINSTFAQYVIKLIKNFMNPKLVRRIIVHSNVESLLDYFPKEILPKDYGGDEISCKELNELLKIKLVEYKERFDLIDTFEIDEAKRPKALVNDELFGMYGNFKKISVD